MIAGWLAGFLLVPFSNPIFSKRGKIEETVVFKVVYDGLMFKFCHMLQHG